MHHWLASGFHWGRESGRRRGRLIALFALSAIVTPLLGCDVGGSATGEGTVDLSRAKESAASNPDIAKAAAARGKATIGDALKTPRR